MARLAFASLNSHSDRRRGIEAQHGRGRLSLWCGAGRRAAATVAEAPVIAAIAIDRERSGAAFFDWITSELAETIS